MKILIANDDGIFAPGIAALVKAFSAAGHEIIVCAPDSQRSAASHAMTLTRPIDVKEVPFEGAAKAYAISGTPVDCVKLAVNCLHPEVDFVLSGINKGWNCGSDIIYSGTVGAAREGAIFGYPSMAVSLAPHREDLYDRAAQLALEMMDVMTAHTLPPHAMLNVNYPAVDKPLGIVAVPMKHTHYNEHFTRHEREDGSVYYTLNGSVDMSMEKGKDDWSMLENGYATATVIGFDMTDYKATSVWQSILESEQRV